VQQALEMGALHFWLVLVLPLQYRSLLVVIWATDTSRVKLLVVVLGMSHISINSIQYCLSSSTPFCSSNCEMGLWLGTPDGSDGSLVPLTGAI
jgi:hypothetical protein